MPPLRDLGHLLSGVPGLRARDRQVVEEGNELTRRSVVLLNLACACGVPCSIENPASSLIWRHPKMQQWISDWNISICETHLCQWGRPYKKATTIAASYTSITLLNAKCSGGHVHVILRGKDADGVFLAKKAAAYPILLCEAWAGLDLNADHSTIGQTAHEPHQFYDSSCFPQLPASLVEDPTYKLLYTARWQKDEAIHMLEGRASLKGFYHASRSNHCRGKRLLLLCDNMSCVMAFNKGRCRNYPLLLLCRRMASVALSYMMYPRWRYIESKRNVADEETRPDLIKPPPGLELPYSSSNAVAAPATKRCLQTAPGPTSLSEEGDSQLWRYHM